MAERNNAERDIEMEELKAEIARLKEALADRAQEVRDVLAERATLVRENPATFSVAVILGAALGFFVGAALRGDDSSRW